MSPGFLKVLLELRNFWIGRSNPYPLYFGKADLVAPPVIELGRTGRAVIGHGGGVFEAPAIL